jgi:hypothetical protein
VFVSFRDDHLTLTDHVHQFNSGHQIAGARKDLKPIMGLVIRFTAR